MSFTYRESDPFLVPRSYSRDPVEHSYSRISTGPSRSRRDDDYEYYYYRGDIEDVSKSRRRYSRRHDLDGHRSITASDSKTTRTRPPIDYDGYETDGGRGSVYYRCVLRDRYAGRFDSESTTSRAKIPSSSHRPINISTNGSKGGSTASRSKGRSANKLHPYDDGNILNGGGYGYVDDANNGAGRSGYAGEAAPASPTPFSPSTIPSWPASTTVSSCSGSWNRPASVAGGGGGGGASRSGSIRAASSRRSEGYGYGNNNNGGGSIHSNSNSNARTSPSNHDLLARIDELAEPEVKASYGDNGYGRFPPPSSPPPPPPPPPPMTTMMAMHRKLRSTDPDPVRPHLNGRSSSSGRSVRVPPPSRPLPLSLSSSLSSSRPRPSPPPMPNPKPTSRPMPMPVPPDDDDDDDGGKVVELVPVEVDDEVTDVLQIEVSRGGGRRWR